MYASPAVLSKVYPDGAVTSRFVISFEIYHFVQNSLFRLKAHLLYKSSHIFSCCSSPTVLSKACRCMQALPFYPKFIQSAPWHQGLSFHSKFTILSRSCCFLPRTAFCVNLLVLFEPYSFIQGLRVYASPAVLSKVYPLSKACRFTLYQTVVFLFKPCRFI